MSLHAIALVLVSAVLHTAWNAQLKKVDEKRAFAALLVRWAALFAAVPALWQVAHGARTSWPSLGWATVTSLSWLLYYEWLSLSYQRGDLSVAYPVIRGVSPVAAVALGLAMGELPTPIGLLGVALVVLGVWFISRPSEVRVEGHSIKDAVGVGILSATYSAVDKHGMTLGDPAIYYFACLGLAAVWLAISSHLKDGPDTVRRVERALRWEAMTSGLGDFASYGLVLMALRIAPLMYVIPLRATAVLCSVVVGAMWLKEQQMRQRLAYGLLIVLGIALIGWRG